ncbi:MAG: DinB family protein [Defluviitaleaceae bacterium]|nr:DinB family protein [Defluviitaleaceae bacterium]
MIKSLKEQLENWGAARGSTICFLQQLSDGELRKPLPRKTFTTIFEQIAEMAWVQHGLINALEAKTLDVVDWNIPAFTKDELLAFMASTDARMADLLEKCDGTEEVDWFGESKGVHGHLAIICEHEMMHLGQIHAFCWCLGIQIPQDVRKAMHLTG